MLAAKRHSDCFNSAPQEFWFPVRSVMGCSWRGRICLSEVNCHLLGAPTRRVFSRVPLMLRQWSKVAARLIPEALYLTCFRASFFPFCPLCWPPLFLPFSRYLLALFSPESLEMGRLRMHLSTNSGRKFLPEICVKYESGLREGPQGKK